MLQLEQEDYFFSHDFSSISDKRKVEVQLKQAIMEKERWKEEVI